MMTIPLTAPSLEFRRPETLRDIALPKLIALCEGLGVAHLQRRASDLVEVLTDGTLDRTAGGVPAWATDLTDDGSPIEFSVAFAGDGTPPELRLLVEPQLDEPTDDSSWLAGLSLTNRLHDEFGAGLERFRAIAPLFSPLLAVPCRFSAWHSAAISADGRAAYKVYLNPQVVGAAGSMRLVYRALEELGMHRAIAFCSQNLPEDTEPMYFALDLDDAEEARVKMYVALSGDGTAVDEHLSRQGVIDPGSVHAHVEELTGGRPSIDGRRILVCYAFRATRDLPEVTVHVPIRSHVDDDAEALWRARAMLSDADADALSRGVRAMAQRPLHVGRSLITYVSLRPRRATANDPAPPPRVTVYLSPELYSIAATRRGVSTIPPASGLRVASRTQPATHGPTLQDVLERVTERAELLRSHGLVSTLEKEARVDHAQFVARRLPFFVVGLHDIRQLVHDRTTDARLRSALGLGVREGSDAAPWYTPGLPTSSDDAAFNASGHRVRALVYQAISAVLNANDDATRLAILLALEAGLVTLFSSLDAPARRGARSSRRQPTPPALETIPHEALASFPSLHITADDLSHSLRSVDDTFRILERMFDDLGRDLERSALH